jgi:two-component system sensor histidine kinase AlgZ
MTEQLLHARAGSAQRRAAPPLAATMPLAPPAKTAPGAAGAAWPLYAVTLAGWGLLVLLHAFALRRDAAGRLADIALSVGPPVLVLALASCALAYAFARAGEAMLRPSRLALLGAGFTGAVLVTAAASSVLARLLADGAPLAAFGARLAQQGAFGWWVDACLAALAFLSQAAFAAWRRGQQQTLAAEQARADGLALRLRLLQGQLKPHFLFNALNSISALVRTAERTLAAQALGQLSELLGHVVHASRHSWLTVADEMAFIEAYLDMQLLRYGERLTIELEVGNGDWAALACPPLLFQPLVENAIHHGVEQHHRQCCLRMRLALDDGVIRFAIDNPLAPPGAVRPGPGMGPGMGHGMGHGATRERLAILYGAEASLTGCNDGATYRATLSFPARDHDGA